MIPFCYPSSLASASASGHPRACPSGKPFLLTYISTPTSWFFKRPIRRDGYLDRCKKLASVLLVPPRESPNVAITTSARSRI